MQPTPRGTDRGRGHSRGRGRPNRSRGGSFNTQTQTYTTHHPPRDRHPDHPSVPPHRTVHPSTPVSIILKADQPTGHQVHGIVADLLTRGDHPRGVKVRLRDGRVGRVQRLVSVEEGERGESIVGGAGANVGRDGGSSGGRGGGGGFGIRGGRIERDIREDDEYLYDENKSAVANDGWFAALEQADQRWKDERGGKVVAEDVVKCPVCGEFEGDERAVAHHVEGHFGD